MPLLNYTTTVAPERSLQVIHQILVAHGASAILFEYDASRQVAAVSFRLRVDAATIHYRLPHAWQGALAAMRADPKVPYRLKTETQARRVSWRIIKDWLEAQVAMTELRQVSLDQIMLPFAITEDGRTVYERWRAQLALPLESGWTAEAIAPVTPLQGPEET